MSTPNHRPTTPRSTPNQHRNKRSLPDWIDRALYQFIHSGDYLVKAISWLHQAKDFPSWYNVADPALNVKRKDAIKN